MSLSARFDAFLDRYTGEAPRTSQRDDDPAGSIQEAPPRGVSVDDLDAAADPFAATWRVAHNCRMAVDGRLLLGAQRDPATGDVVLGITERESNCLLLGPPRRGKTTLLAAQINAHVGPVVVITTKDDLAQNTAVPRARLGEVIHLHMTGGAVYPGMTEGRLDLFAGAHLDAGAQLVGRQLARSMGSDDPRSKVWDDSAGEYLAAPLMASKLHERYGMGSAAELFSRIAEHDADAIEDMAENLIEFGGAAGARMLARREAFEKRLHKEALGSIEFTALKISRIFARTGVQDRMRDPNVNLAEMLAANTGEAINPHVTGDEETARLAAMGIAARDGWPGVGRPWTLYVQVDQDDDDAELLLRLFVHMLWSAIKERHRLDGVEGINGRPKVLLAYDELATGFRDPRYLRIASQSADQDLIISAAAHDLGQFGEYSANPEGFLNAHRYVLVWPGIRHTGTLQAISTICGNHDQDQQSTNGGLDAQGKVHYGWGVSAQRRAHLDAGEVGRGHPTDPKAVLCLTPDGWCWVWPTPIFAARPWPKALVASMAYVVGLVRVADGKAHHLGALPYPELDRTDDTGVPILVRSHPQGAELLEQYRWLKDRFAVVRDKHPSPEPFTPQPLDVDDETEGDLS